MALVARGLESDARKGAERHILALAAETVAVEPQLGPIGPDYDAEALAVGNRVLLVRRRCVADFRVAQFIHGKAPSQSGDQPVYPALPVYPQCTRKRRMPSDGREPYRASIYDEMPDFTRV